MTLALAGYEIGFDYLSLACPRALVFVFESGRDWPIGKLTPGQIRGGQDKSRVPAPVNGCVHISYPVRLCNWALAARAV